MTMYCYRCDRPVPHGTVICSTNHCGSVAFYHGEKPSPSVIFPASPAKPAPGYGTPARATLRRIRRAIG